MIYRFLLISLLVGSQILSARSEGVNHAKVAFSELDKAVAMLEATKTGAAELARARELRIPIIAGQVSKTDITATRVMIGNEEKLTYQTEVMVAQDKEAAFQALDLAHELVHATNPKNNPFDPSLNLADYVKHGIEGAGGEAQAIAAECKAGQEMIEQTGATALKTDTIQTIKARCQFVWKTVPQDSKWKQSFYHLGNHYGEFLSQVAGLHLKENEKADWRDKVESKSPMFASAVAHKPYPLALLEEYVEITKRVCEKTKLKSINRAIASISLLQERCRAVGATLIE